VTYLAAAQIEARAAELWRDHALQPGFDIEQLVDALGLGLVWEDVEDDGGGRILGQLVPDERTVILNQRHLDDLEARGGRLRRYTLGHAVGHCILHAAAARRGGVRLFDRGRTWCRDGSPDPVERQAERFAATLLMPREFVRDRVPTTPWSGWPTVYSLAEHFVVNATPMAIRLEELGLMHRVDGNPVSGVAPVPGQEALFS
jgi:Zn-dependent peptidase ImmA (M78 family)